MHCSPPWHEEGARKGALNIACSNLPWPDYRSWRGPYFCGRKLKKKPRTIPLTLGTWNVRTLMDRDETNRPQRRTALVGHELSRYDVDIAALSETRLPGEGELSERGSGYTFFWSGRGSEERREAGVGFAMKTSLVCKLASPPKCINDRLMTMRLPLLAGKKYLNIISCYAPTMTNPDEVKSKFYEDLHSIIANIPSTDKLVILGDFNARVGCDDALWDGAIGKHGVGRCNSNGLLLLQTCVEHDLLITNTVFSLPTRNRTSWMHPRSKHWHLIDYVITRKKDRQDVRVTKSLCGAECWTDHRLIISKLKICIQPKRRPQGRKTLKRLNITKLNCASTKQSLETALEGKLRSTTLNNTNIETVWTNFRDLIYSTASQILGPATRKHQDWFDDNCVEIKQMLAEKHQLHKRHISNPRSSTVTDSYNSIRRVIQQKLRWMRDSWLNKKADEIQQYADRHDMKNFYNAIKEVYGPTTSNSSPLLSADGTYLITDGEKILERWAEHFHAVLNSNSSINEDAISRLPQVPINLAMDDPPTLLETQRAVHLMSCGKAPGVDSIPAEIYKEGGIDLKAA